MWMEETCVNFPILLDPDRESYAAYGFHRSLLRSWGLKTFFTYVKLLISGRKWRGVQGDSAQLGGDVIIDGNSIIRFIHRSMDPSDRPSAETLLRVL
jgi:hypothetical protein